MSHKNNFYPPIFSSSQKGVSLIITFFILTIILAVVLSISIILYREIKIIRSIGNSVVSFYAADSGIEKTLYYDRKERPSGVESGVCAMCDSENPSCPSDYPTDQSVACHCEVPTGADCDSLSCESCTVSFHTHLDSYTNYYVTANTSISGAISDLTVSSNGDFENTKRAIQVLSIKDASGSSWTACGDTLTDERDGKTYTTVLIGAQCWMRQNINVGTLTAGVNTQGTTCPSATAIEKYCYSNDEANCTAKGGLYQWDQAMCGSTTAGAIGICPTGWHIPTHDEFTTLELAICNSTSCTADFPYNTSTTGWRGTNEGTTLKTVDSAHFSGLLTGYRSRDGAFYNLTSDAGFLSSFRSGSSAWRRYLMTSRVAVYRGTYDKEYGLSVRCLKD